MGSQCYNLCYNLSRFRLPKSLFLHQRNTQGEYPSVSATFLSD